MPLSDKDRDLLIGYLLRNKTVAESGCWEWAGCLNTNGYGAAVWRGRRWNASRLAGLAWLDLPEKQEEAFVCHHCDNPRCLNPLHLYVGTAKTNFDDMLRRGRWKPQAKRPTCNKGHVKTGKHCRQCSMASYRARRKLKTGVEGHSEWRKQSTACKNGHPFDEANTRWYTNKSGYCYRLCRKCQMANTARWKAAGRG